MASPAPIVKADVRLPPSKPMYPVKIGLPPSNTAANPAVLWVERLGAVVRAATRPAMVNFVDQLAAQWEALWKALPSGPAPAGLHKCVSLMLTFDDGSTLHTGLSLELHGKPGAQPGQDSYEIRLCAEDPKDYTTRTASNHLLDLQFAHNVYSAARRGLAAAKITTMDRGVHVIAEWLWGFCRQTCPYTRFVPMWERRQRTALAPVSPPRPAPAPASDHQGRPVANASWRSAAAEPLSTAAATEAPLPSMDPLTDHVKKVPGGYMVLCSACGADTANIKTVDAKKSEKNARASAGKATSHTLCSGCARPRGRASSAASDSPPALLCQTGASSPTMESPPASAPAAIEVGTDREGGGQDDDDDGVEEEEVDVEGGGGGGGAAGGGGGAATEPLGLPSDYFGSNVKYKAGDTHNTFGRSPWRCIPPHAVHAQAPVSTWFEFASKLMFSGKPTDSAVTDGIYKNGIVVLESMPPSNNPCKALYVVRYTDNTEEVRAYNDLRRDGIAYIVRQSDPLAAFEAAVASISGRRKLKEAEDEEQRLTDELERAKKRRIQAQKALEA